MKNSGLSPSELSEIVTCLHKHPKIQQAFLFGSRAKGDFRPGSDVDLAVIGLNHTEAVKLSASLNEDTLLPYKFDIVVYETISSPELLAHIDRVGMPLLPNHIDLHS